jgi:hypothetical protein
MTTARVKSICVQRRFEIKIQRYRYLLFKTNRKGGSERSRLNPPGFDWRGVVSNLRVAITVLALLAGLPPTVAVAQDSQVASNLTTYGGVSRNEANAIIQKISEQMQKAANSIIGLNDPIRRAMRVGMFGSAPTPQQDSANDAKARLYLYSGLTMQSLRILFRAGQGMLAVCIENFQITGAQCEALVAASVQRPIKEVAVILTKQQPTAMPVQPVAPVATAQPVYTTVQTTQRPVYTPAPTQQVTYTPAPRPLVTSTPVYQPAPQPVYQPAPVARPPVATTTPAAPVRPANTSAAANANTAAATAAAYKERREKYLAGFKQKAEEKKAKDAATATEPRPVPSKTETTTSPEVFDTAAQAKSPPAAASTPEAKPAAKAPAAAPVAAKPAEKAKEPPKENDAFLSDLLSDPLGKKK